MEGKTVVITGSTAGIGYYSALGIARTGARVVITGRDKARGEAARQQIAEAANNQNVELVIGNVSSLASIDALAKELLVRIDKLDVLVNNAGYMGNERTTSDDGLEMHFAVNVLAPWRLTHALLPALKKGTGRVLNLTAGDAPSGTPVPLNVDNLQAEKGFKGLLTMAHSKSVMEAMSVATARELEAEGVTVNIIWPGRASTAMTRSVSMKGLPGPMKPMICCFMCMVSVTARGLERDPPPFGPSTASGHGLVPHRLSQFAKDGGKSAAKASRSTVWAAIGPELDGVTGKYYDNNMKERKLHKKAASPKVQEQILAVLKATLKDAPQLPV